MSDRHLDTLLFLGAVPSGATKYVAVPIRDGKLGCQVGWKDATSSATVTLELSSFPGASIDGAGQAWEWKDSGLTFTGPVGAAAGSTSVNIENARQLMARLKIVAAAACAFEIRDGTAP
jgi:hypothetical protein